MVGLGKLLGGVDPRKLTQVVDFVWDSKDDLVSAALFARQLPELVLTLSNGLAEAGAQARAASIALVGEDGKSGAMPSMAHGAGSLGTISDSLGKMSGFIAGAADEVGKVPLMGGPAKQLGGAAASITGTTADLTGLGEDLLNMAGVLAQVAAALAKLGESLDVSSRKARTLVDV
ncbi:MAG: hypothetical protein M3Q98_09370 [Actinomycetota bacterium]|nr:hypothetical protein [Actinomycetota bacterium]